MCQLTSFLNIHSCLFLIPYILYYSIIFYQLFIYLFLTLFLSNTYIYNIYINIHTLQFFNVYSAKFTHLQLALPVDISVPLLAATTSSLTLMVVLMKWTQSLPGGTTTRTLMVFRSSCHGVGQIPAQMLSYLTNFLLLLVPITLPITNTYSIVQYLKMKNVKKQNVRVLTFCPVMNNVLKIAGTIGLVVARK